MKRASASGQAQALAARDLVFLRVLRAIFAFFAVKRLVIASQEHSAMVSGI
jgi:hypothetical protein